MKWFTGSIIEAISFAQRQKHVFVAYTEGSCTKSKAMSSVFNDKEVTDELEKSSFVCVKLEANSVGYKQLVEIYRRVPIPSLFFISHYGLPLDIVDGNLSDGHPEMKMLVIESAVYSREMNAKEEPPRTVSGEKLLEERRQQVDEILDKKTKQADTKVKSADEGAMQTAKQNLDEAEQLKKSKKDAELKKIVDEREKERMEEANARQRILDQIAQDKADRAQRMKAASENGPSTSSIPTVEKPKPPPTISNEARIQFRLPTGESKSSMFPKTTNLNEIRDYIDKNLELSYRDYRLATTFPRREFTSEDGGSNLEELELIPTAVLLILPKSSGNVNPLTGSWFKVITDMVQSFLQPLYSLSNYLTGLVFRPSNDGTNSQPTQSPPDSSQQRQSQPSRTQVRKAGNIHSLRDLRDGNDENNTWNGNSTQQM